MARSTCEWEGQAPAGAVFPGPACVTGPGCPQADSESPPAVDRTLGRPGSWLLGTSSKEVKGYPRRRRRQGFLGDYQEQGSSSRDMGLSAKTCSEQFPGFLAR